jgi:hypothetical protein
LALMEMMQAGPKDVTRIMSATMKATVPSSSSACWLNWRAWAST